MPSPIPLDAWHRVEVGPIIPTPNLSVIRDARPTPAVRPRANPVLPTPPVVVIQAAPPVAHAGAPTVTDAKAYALSVLGSVQYACLDQIAIHESHWNPYDLNSSSGAYGIPQAVPGSKMAWAGADWHDNPVTQVKWMVHYVDGRYGSACSAWSFWQTNRWY
jgi:hypothetical protein